MKLWVKDEVIVGNMWYLQAWGRGVILEFHVKPKAEGFSVHKEPLGFYFLFFFLWCLEGNCLE
jgi:hypothetical protein